MSTQFPISGLRSVELQVPDLVRAVAFYTEVWGLLEAARSDHKVWLRGAGTDPYILRLTEGAETAVISVTFRAASETDLRRLRAAMIATGASAEGDIGPVEEHGGGSGFKVRDAIGRKFCVVQDDLPGEPLQDDACRPERLAHVNINSGDMERDLQFFQQGMGMQYVDFTGKMGFLRTNDDHHIIVLAKGPVNTLNHIAFNHTAWENVMTAGGRMCDAGHPVAWGPGRHGPGDNVFLYFLDPFGVVIEHTAEVLVVDDAYKFGGPEDWVWPEGRTDQWGIAPPKPERCVQAQLAIPFV